MSDGFTSYCLVQDGSAVPVLEKRSSKSFQEITSPPPAEEPDILLQSGFSSLKKKSQTMLSPALQVNGDLGCLNDEQLLSFAEAERLRKNQISFSSYTVEADNRLCVISNNSQSLSRFCDTYGGVLDIVPLLVNASHPDFSEVTDLSVSFTESTCRVEYSTRSPVDLSKCTYCGLCGRICPETCISETLFFNFEACSFCRECEKLCPAGAIDIDTIEQNTLEIPAVLVLGDTVVEGTEGHRNFYRESTLDQYFSTLFPCRIDEVITCSHDICQFSSRAETGCDKCLQVCAFDAITGGESIQIDALRCTECGNCTGICPTGAMQYRRFDDTAFFEFFRTFSLKKSSTIVIGTEQELHSFWWNYRETGTDTGDHVFFEYPTLNALSAVHLIFLLVHGASRIILLENENNNNQSAHQAADEVNGLFSALFDTPSPVSLSTVRDYPTQAAHFDNTSILSRPYTDLSYSNRRQKLSSMVLHALSESQNDVIMKAEQTTIFHAIECDENACTQCLACLNECNIKSLSADPSALSLSWTGALCTGCSACIDVCPEDALSTGRQIHLNQEFFKPLIVARAEPMCCKECGKVFGTRKSFDRVMEILAQQKLDHDGHFEYCEDCRVIKLLETE